MNSLEIQYFLTIVKYGSFTEAAQALSVSQPAISKQIRQLEAELGCSLFARSGRTLSLTEAGQAYYSAVLFSARSPEKQAGRSEKRRKIYHPDCVSGGCGSSVFS